jgi:DNA-binding transcriptional LysR family regulator
MKLGSFDLNLLVVFEAVFQERSVTLAGDRLGLSQPAVSHALRRLRHLVKDDLFVKTPEGMMPTPRAEQLILPVRHALNELILALEPETFNAASAERSFTLAVNNYAAVVLAGPIIAKCAALAPGIRLSLRPSGTLNVAEMLERGELDLVISNREPPSGHFASSILIKDRYVVAMREGNSTACGSLSLAAFAELPYVAISSSGEDLSFVDSTLAKHGLSRKVVLDVPYLSAGAVLTKSDMAAVLGRHLAQEFCRSHPLDIKDLPFESPQLRISMLWHERLDKQPSHRWLRETIAAVAAVL